MECFFITRFHDCPFSSTGVEGVFAITWLLFALMVIAGNLTGLLYTPGKQRKKQSSDDQVKKRMKSRHYH